MILSGGLIGDDLTTHDATSFSITGGNIGHSILMNDSSTGFIGGGTVVADIFVQNASSLTMRGIDLVKTLTDANFEGGFYSQFTFTG